MPLFLHCCVSHFFLSASTLCLCSKYCCLTKFCSANSSTFASSSFSVVMLLKMAKDRWGGNRFTGGKGHQTLPLLVPQRHALSLVVILWLHPRQDGTWFGTNTCPLHHWVLLPAVPVSCVTHSRLRCVCFHTRSHSSALWQLCRGTQHWKECCSSAKSTFTSVSALCYPL